MMVTILTVINTNVGALMARTYSAKAAQRTTSSMERLASGKRINSAADDAAGLAVANKMESQQRGQKVGLRNSQDGISLSQTAESGMSKITHLMLRIRELAVQMDNGVYTQKDRDNAQMEVDALIAEIDKIHNGHVQNSMSFDRMMLNHFQNTTGRLHTTINPLVLSYHSRTLKDDPFFNPSSLYGSILHKLKVKSENRI